MAALRTAVVLPARYASVRLPGKPLLAETGRPLIRHVYEQAKRARCGTRVVVATDVERNRAAVAAFGGEVVMTRADHASGTDRVAEVAQALDVEVVVNLQGDEPQFPPDALDVLVELLAAHPDAAAATLMTPIRDLATYLSPNCVKVVADDAGRALYFSRSPVPLVRDGGPDFAAEPPLFHLHLGVYAYRRDALLRLAATPPHPLELAEKLEQLRILANGGSIRVAAVPHAHRGVDTPEDYAAFVASYRRGRPAG